MRRSQLEPPLIIIIIISTVYALSLLVMFYEKLRMRSDVLFAPANGNNYTAEDRKRVFAQQPIREFELPATYLLPSPTSPLKPPLLVYGWRVGHGKVMAVAHERFPQDVLVRLGPDVFGHEEDSEYINALPREEWTTSRVNISATLWESTLVDDICTAVGIRDKQRSALFNILLLHDENAEPAVGVIVGSTFNGRILDEPYYSRIQAMFAPNEAPAWYLHQSRWTWRRETTNKVRRTTRASAPKAETQENV